MQPWFVLRKSDIFEPSLWHQNCQTLQGTQLGLSGSFSQKANLFQAILKRFHSHSFFPIEKQNFPIFFPQRDSIRSSLSFYSIKVFLNTDTTDSRARPGSSLKAQYCSCTHPAAFKKLKLHPVSPHRSKHKKSGDKKWGTEDTEEIPRVWIQSCVTLIWNVIQPPSGWGGAEKSLKLGQAVWIIFSSHTEELRRVTVEKIAWCHTLNILIQSVQGHNESIIEEAEIEKERRCGSRTLTMQLSIAGNQTIFSKYLFFRCKDECYLKVRSLFGRDTL